MEKVFPGRPKLMEMTRGFIRNEFLKPLNGDTYIFLSYWETREDFEAWRKTAAGKRAFPVKFPRSGSSPAEVIEVHEVIGVSERIREVKD